MDWFPWGDEALEKARAEDKPIFLSVGYAACHWCHVMERESFEDPDTAALLNEHFVSIKVDREERPDIDATYMDAVQAMNNGQGGWPMSVFLTPDVEPFFAGTYFPDEPRFGTPSFRQILQGIIAAWRDRRSDVREQATRVVEVLGRSISNAEASRTLTEEITTSAFRSLRASFDARWGGFGGAPKFPQPMVLEFLLRLAARGVPDALDMVTITLDRMAAGGIRDQVGGGFARYATDAAWHIPHFEKMLYDNAQLARVYANAWLVRRDQRFRDVSMGIVDELLREMHHPEGGFFSSQDADSEGVEGRFFTWTWDELVRLVGEPVAVVFGATPEGNWQEPGSATRTNVLWQPQPISAVAAELGLDVEELTSDVEKARTLLRTARERRTRPGIDDKVLTAWNALAIRALCDAGRAFGEARFIEAAVRCASFVWSHLRGQDGRLLRSWRNGSSTTPAFADDHALFALASLSVYEATGDSLWFERARETGDELLRLFHDDDEGGFFQVGRDAEPVLVRQKDVFDNATPSGNSAAAEALLRLSMFTADGRYEDAAQRALQLVANVVERAPTGFGHALCALDLFIGPRKEVAIVGRRGDPGRDDLVHVVSETLRPNVVLAVGDGTDGDPASVPLLQDRVAIDGDPTAYVCEGFTCRMPDRDVSSLRRSLEAT